MLINNYLPAYSFIEYHDIVIKTGPTDLYPVLMQTDFSRSGIIKFLFKLRGMSTPGIAVKDMDKLGFIKLAENPPEEILFGIATHSWMFNGCESLASPEAFQALNGEGHIKAVINFRLRAIDDTTLLSTETRIYCTDEKIKRKFRIYWFFISPFSRLIRKKMLKRIRKEFLNHDLGLSEP